MPYLMIRQRFSDYPQWRAAFDRLADTRARSGINTLLVTRNMDDPGEVVVLFEFTEIERVHEHLRSPALQEAHRQAGVLDGTTTATFLEPTHPRAT